MDLYKTKKSDTFVVFGKTCSECNYGNDCGDKSGNGPNNGVNGAENATGTPKTK